MNLEEETIFLENLLDNQHRPGGTWTCNCGRFAKFLSESHYYNGEFDCYSYTVDCKRCGVVTVECV